MSHSDKLSKREPCDRASDHTADRRIDGRDSKAVHPIKLNTSAEKLENVNQQDDMISLKALKDFLNTLGNGRRSPENSLNLSEAIDLYIDSQSVLVAEASLKTYQTTRTYLTAYFTADPPIISLSKTDMLAWRKFLFGLRRYELHPTMQTLDEKISNTTIRNQMSSASAIFNWLVSMELLDRNPLQGIEKPPKNEDEPASISRDDFKKLLEAAGTYGGNHPQIAERCIARDTAIIWFLASGGCRVGGLCNARLSKLQIYDDGAEIELIEKGRGGGKKNIYTLNEMATIALMVWLDVRPDVEHDYIFTVIWGKTSGKPVKPQTIRKLLKRLEKQLGITIDNNNPHAFRHALAEMMIEAGADLTDVRDALNHSSIHMTERYVRNKKKKFRKRKAKFDLLSD